MPKVNGLTPKQKIFVQEYLIDFNAGRAAKKAGYTEKSAYAIGCENLIKPEIQKEIALAVDKRNKIIGVDQRYVVENIHMLIEKHKKDPKQITNVARLLELLAKHTGCLIERHEHKIGFGSFADMVKEMHEKK